MNVLKERYGQVRFRFVDIACIGYLLLIGSLLIFFHKNVPNWPLYVVLHVAIVLGILELVRWGERGRVTKIKRFIRIFYPTAVSLFAWGELDAIDMLFFNPDSGLNPAWLYMSPAQVMADLFTITEKKPTLEDVTIAYVGDGNNVCNSLISASIILGFKLSIAAPSGYEPNKEYTARAGNTELTNDPEKAIADADIIYTDVWASMGQENEAAKRKQIFKPFQINQELLKHTKKDYLIMHCLPAHRGEEITDEVIDGKHSIVLDQAENRLHAQKGIMVWLNQNS